MPKKVIFEKKNVLVIGGAGFIGSRLCDELVKDNKVICLDNFSTGDERNIDHLLSNPNFEFVRHDIVNSIDLDSLPELQKFKIQFQGVQEIYHLACPTSPKDFLKNRIPTILANSYGTKNALDIAIKYESKFLYFSSSVVYGPRRSDNAKIKENDVGHTDFLSERSSYDEGKRFSEAMVVNFGSEYKISTKIIRLFRTYGPRMKMEDCRMIPDFIASALDNKDVVIFGDEEFYSSFCYVDDCVEAAVKLMESDVSGPVNIGSDMEVSLTSLAEKIILMTGSKSKIVYSDPILFMTPLCLPDITRARNELGWMPVVSLENGLEKTIYELRASKGLKGVEHVSN